MQITNLSLSNFRIFKRLEIDFSGRLTLLVGNNAQGKTSVLEAVHLLSILTSPIASNDRQVVNILSLSDEMPVSRVVGHILKKEKKHTIEIRLILNSNHGGNGRLRKEVLIDGVKRRLFEAVGFFNSVLFLPQMTRILEDGPDERRKYLDQLFSQAFQGYVKALSDYQQALSRRNALLRQLFEKGGDQNQLLYWDEMIAANGAIIIQARLKSLAEFEIFLKEQYGKLTGGKEDIRIEYQPSFNGGPMKDDQMSMSILSREESSIDYEEIKQKFIKQLASLRREEIQRGVTTIGPHRDEIRFFSNTMDLGVYGSRGQIRTAVMAMKIAEIQWLREKIGELPVLLLDETLAELDEFRRNDLLSNLGLEEQAILTTADLGMFSEEFIKTCQVWQVEEGKINKAGA